MPVLWPSPWPGRAFDDRIVIGDAGLLRRLRNAVDVRAERDHRLAGCPRSRPTRSECRDCPRCTLKPNFSSCAGEVLRGLDFLHAQLAEAEHRVHHLLRELGHLVDALDGFLFLRRRASRRVAALRLARCRRSTPAPRPRSQRRTPAPCMASTKLRTAHRACCLRGLPAVTPGRRAARVSCRPCLSANSIRRDRRMPLAERSSIERVVSRVVSRYRRCPRWAGGHKMTVYAWARARRFPQLPAPDRALFRRRARRARARPLPLAGRNRQPHPTLLLLHGLEGSSEAHYMRGMADKAWAARLQRRPAQPAQLRRHRAPVARAVSLGTDRRSAVRADASCATRDGLTRFGVAGYSLGGNLAMKLAGELGASDLPEAESGSPPCRRCIELEACVQAIERRAEPDLRVELLPQPAGPHAPQGAHFPDVFNLDGLWKIWSIRAFDERYTAPHHGFDGAERLLPPRQRDARDRSRRASGADPQRRRRPVRAAARSSTRAARRRTIRTSRPS